LSIDYTFLSNTRTKYTLLKVHIYKTDIHYKASVANETLSKNIGSFYQRSKYLQLEKGKKNTNRNWLDKIPKEKGDAITIQGKGESRQHTQPRR